MVQSIATNGVNKSDIPIGIGKTIGSAVNFGNILDSVSNQSVSKENASTEKTDEEKTSESLASQLKKMTSGMTVCTKCGSMFMGEAVAVCAKCGSDIDPQNQGTQQNTQVNSTTITQ